MHLDGMRKLCERTGDRAVQQRRALNMHGLQMQPGNKVQQKLAAVALALLASTARGQELDAAWFEANYLPAAQKLEKAYGECTAKVSRTVTNDKSKKVSKTTLRFAFDGTRRKFDRTTESRQEDGSIDKSGRSIVASPEVSFMVSTSGAGGQLLEQVNRSPLGLMQAIAQIDDTAFETIYAPFSLLDKRMSQWLKDKNFEIRSVTREGTRVRLAFHWKNDDREYDGWVDFLPDRQWVIDRWEMRLKMFKPTEYHWRVAASMSYGSDNPVPALSGSTVIDEMPKVIANEKIVVDALTFAAAPASEFKLSSYGFDDRIGMPASTFRSLWFWLAIGGVTCLLASLAIRQVMVRRAAA